MTKQQLKIQEMVLTYSPEGVYKMVLDGRLKQFPMGFWGMQDSYVYASRCTRYLVENVLRWNRKEICENYNFRVIKEGKLMGIIGGGLKMTVYETLENAYPGKFKPWELKAIEKSLWDKETLMRALGWLINEKLGWGIGEVKNKLTINILRDYGIASPVNQLYRGNLAMALVGYYGFDRFKPWELTHGSVPNGYWTDETADVAMNWLIVEKLNWGKDDVKEKYTSKTLRDNGLASLLEYKNTVSLYGLIVLVYNDILPWELGYVRENYWEDKTNCVVALNWLGNELGCDRVMLADKINLKVLRSYGMLGLHSRCKGIEGVRSLILTSEWMG